MLRYKFCMPTVLVIWGVTFTLEYYMILVLLFRFSSNISLLRGIINLRLFISNNPSCCYYSFWLLHHLLIFLISIDRKWKCHLPLSFWLVQRRIQDHFEKAPCAEFQVFLHLPLAAATRADVALDITLQAVSDAGLACLWHTLVAILWWHINIDGY